MKLYLLSLLVVALLLFGCTTQNGKTPKPPSANLSLDAQAGENASNATITNVTAVFCTVEYRPVCGKDGRTYSNPCLANVSNTSIVSEGACSIAKACTDSDFGRDILLQGTATTEKGASTDVCISTTSILEFYCVNSQMTNQSITCPDGHICRDGACIKSVIILPKPNVSTTSTRCSDTDNGTNTLIKGTVTDGARTYDDVCTSINGIKEYYCQNDAMANSNYECATGHRCFNGACVPFDNLCTDSDGGKNPEQRGTLVLQTPVAKSVYTDQCIGSSLLREYYCLAGQTEVESITCGTDYECLDGACFLNKCIDSDSANSIYINGSARIGTRIEYDGCTDTYAGFEVYCSANQLTSQRFTCPPEYRCDNGRCIPSTQNFSGICSDPDGGVFSRIGGTTTKGAESRPDYCITNSTIIEYFCNSAGNIDYISVDCGSSFICISNECRSLN